MPSTPKSRLSLSRQNLAYAKAVWPAQSSTSTLTVLRELSTRFGFSISLGEVRILDGGWYVTHGGLLRLAERRQCRGILIEPVSEFSDPTVGRWVFKATLYKSPRSHGFVGYGDADPSNVSSLVHGAEMHMAETRAVNRGLRKVYGSVRDWASVDIRHNSKETDESKTLEANASFCQAPRSLRPRFVGSTSAASLFISSRNERSRRNSICLFSERCSRPASSISLALRLSGMRIRRRA